MHDPALDKIAGLLLEARKLVRDDHPAVVRLAMDITLLQVGRCIAGTLDGDDRIPSGGALAPPQGRHGSLRGH